MIRVDSDDYGMTFYTGLNEIVREEHSRVYHLGSKAWQFSRSPERIMFTTLCGIPYRTEPPRESYGPLRRIATYQEPPSGTRFCRGCARSKYLHGVDRG